MNDEAPLLTYVYQTTPSPLQSGKRGTITLIPSNGDPSLPIVCHKISVTFSVGPNAADLTADTSGIVTPDPPGFTARCPASIYTAAAISPQGVSIADSIRLELQSIAINDRNGATTIYIDEEASAAGQPRKLRSTTIQLAKLPPEFTLSRLTAIPDTVESGHSAVLNWKGTKLPDLVTYKLSWMKGTQKQERTVDPEGPLTIDDVNVEPQTKFKLVAHVGGAEPVEREAFVNVTPRAPVIDSFRGTVIGSQIKLSWSAKYATTCKIDSGQYDPVGEATVPLDRLCYVLTAKNGTRTISAVAVLKLTKTNATGPDPRKIWRNFDAFGDKLVAASNGIGCALIDATSLEIEKVLLAPPEGSSYVNAVTAVSANGLRIFASMSAYGKTNYIQLFDQRGNSVVLTNPRNWVEMAIFSPAGDALFVITSDPAANQFTVDRYAAMTLQYQASKTYDGSVFSGTVCMSPAGDRLFIGAFTSVWAIETATGDMKTTEVGDRNGIRTMNCWNEGDDLRVLVGTEVDGAVLLDGKTLTKIRDTPFHPVMLLGTGLLANRGAWTGVSVLDRSTLTQLAALPIVTAAAYLTGFAFTGGNLYVTQVGGIARWAATSAERVTPQTGYEVLTSDNAVVVLASKNEPVTFLVEGTNVEAEAPSGWRLRRDGNAFSFEPLDDDMSGVHPFVFRNVDGEAVTLSEQTVTRTLRLGR